MTTRPQESSSFRLRCLEQLESRELLHGHALAAAFSHFAAANVASSHFVAESASSPLARLGIASISSLHSESNETVLSGTLADATTGATGTATFKSGTEDGTTTTVFRVSVSGATAGSTLDVSINGTLVGELTTDDTGAGTLTLSSNPTGTQQSLPTDFPTDIAAGAAVTVSSLSGTLDTSSATTHGGCGSHQNGISASLTDSASSATGTARFFATTSDSSATSKLKVTVSGATASSTLDVSIDGTLVGELTTDESGDGTVSISNPAVTPAAGSTITVGTLSGTFAASEDASSSFVHFSRRR